MRPLIGITTKISLDDHIGIHTNLGCKDQSWLLLADDYVKSVEQAGGVPVIIPIMENIESAFTVLERLDGIIFTGGNDVNPKYYNEDAEFEYKSLVDSLDEFEINLYKKVYNDSTMPILGICRGLQLINTVHGGKLFQEMRMGEYPKHTYSKVPVPKNELIHTVSVSENSRLFDVVQQRNVLTNSFHHQSIKVLGDGLTVNAISEDGIVEGIEGVGGRFLLGVQWHPEMLAPADSINDPSSRKIFEAFVKASEIFQQKNK